MALANELPLPINDGYYRIRSVESQLSITMKESTATDDVYPACNTIEADTDDLSQRFYVRYNGFTDTYTIRNMGKGRYLATRLQIGWDGDGIVGTIKPQPWCIDAFALKNDPAKKGYRMFIPGCAREYHHGAFVTGWNGAKNPGEKVGVTWTDEDWNHCKIWKFEPMPPPHEGINYPPLTTMPALLPGTFKIQNVGCHTFLTQSDEDPDSAVLGDPPRKNKIQKWTISIDRETQLFTLQSDEGHYLAADKTNASVIAAEKPQLWDIKQAEFPEQFVFYLPGTHHVLHMENIANNAMNITWKPRDGDDHQQQKWMILSLAADPKTISHSVPPFFPVISNGVYRISNVRTHRPLSEAAALIDKRTYPGKVGPLVSAQPHSCENEKELWKIEVQPNVLTYTIRNVVSGRYLIPPNTWGARGPEAGAHPMTSNTAYLWDIRQSHYNNCFCIVIPGTIIDLHCWGRIEEGHVVIWRRCTPDEWNDCYVFNPIGDWKPPNFPCNLHDLDALTKVPEVAATPVMQQRDRNFLEVVVDYAKKALGKEH